MPGDGFAKALQLMAILQGDSKHAEAAGSTLDALWVLYDRILRVSPAMEETRDRFYLSKGHGPMAYYAVLAAKGFLDPAELYQFGSFHSVLGHHPDRMRIPGVEISSGSLGHGLPLAVGTALGLRARKILQPRIWVLVGDGELDEGSNAEAICYAGRAGLDTLHVVVIDNASASHGWPGGIEARFLQEGWSATRVDGRSHQDLADAYAAPHPHQPRVVVADVGRPGERAALAGVDGATSSSG